MSAAPVRPRSRRARTGAAVLVALASLGLAGCDPAGPDLVELATLSEMDHANRIYVTLADAGIEGIRIETTVARREQRFVVRVPQASERRAREVLKLTGALKSSPEGLGAYVRESESRMPGSQTSERALLMHRYANEIEWQLELCEEILDAKAVIWIVSDAPRTMRGEAEAPRAAVVARLRRPGVYPRFERLAATSADEAADLIRGLVAGAVPRLDPAEVVVHFADPDLRAAEVLAGPPSDAAPGPTAAPAVPAVPDGATETASSPAPEPRDEIVPTAAERPVRRHLAAAAALAATALALGVAVLGRRRVRRHRRTAVGAATA